MKKAAWKLSALPIFAAVLGALLLGMGPARAQQDWPQRPIQIIIPFAAGGSIDITFRLIAPSLSKRLGQQVLVVNKPGGGATIGMNEVAKSPPDGYTLGAASFSFAANPVVLKDIPYDAVKDFDPVTLVSRSPFLLLVNSKSPAHNVKEFVDWVKSKPGDLNFTSVGIGSSGHMVAELFLTKMNLKMVHVPFTTTAFASLANDQVQLLFGPIPSSMSWIKDGKMRALAVTSLKPDPSLPDVPPVADTIPGFDQFEWPSLVAPKGTPRAIIDKIQKAVAETVAEPEVKQRLAQLGSQPVGSTPEELGKLIADQIKVWAEVGKNLSTVREAK
jgi:tripartite-type tricarboxylate transporter receptor subunit TctC